MLSLFCFCLDCVFCYCDVVRVVFCFRGVNLFRFVCWLRFCFCVWFVLFLFLFCLFCCLVLFCSCLCMSCLSCVCFVLFCFVCFACVDMFCRCIVVLVLFCEYWFRDSGLVLVVIV